MTIASDQDKTPGELSPTARRMLVLRDEVVAEWQKRMRAEVRQAGALPDPILTNTLPTFYDNLVQAISHGHPRSGANAPATTVASEHGSERARLTDYDVAAVISEYQLFRRTVLDVLKLHQVTLSEEDLIVIGGAFDATIKESVTAFALAQSVFRERFVAALAHDLRTPLGAISLLAELIRIARDPQKPAELSTQILANVKRMDRMIQDLLDAVVFQSGARQTLHLTSFDILGILEEIRAQNMMDIDRIRVEGQPAVGWWDRENLKRAVENLVGNALKYGAAGRPITIRAQEYHQRLLLSVHNEGAPIPPEQLEAVFQVFQRAKMAQDGNKRGWGIGLPFARSVAESHGGSIGVESADDVGTTFVIDIPMDARPFLSAPVLAERPR